MPVTLKFPNLTFIQALFFFSGGNWGQSYGNNYGGGAMKSGGGFGGRPGPYNRSKRSCTTTHISVVHFLLILFVILNKTFFFCALCTQTSGLGKIT